MTAEHFSDATKGKLIYLHQRDPHEALERLNRITGLNFARWPESLVSPLPEPEPLAERNGCAARVGG
ncbi:hypothetical protein LJY18_10995 [Pseudomonas sp. MMS21-TM103]|uniref:hypothetical protein n=1 Tax=Pseudomonas sp. MMS21 TM103 TaxID=2886506 RepID=UPI001EDEA822|nr:hypothetical protein [Pseudomonas sp. MMS21 TM103]MCG4453823.1 hypothetical protein [Pseudomonas sp. MMS21 TM103]